MRPVPPRPALRAVRRFVVWCLLVAVPVFGVSGTLVELLGTVHVHRAAAASVADPMRGWVDPRRGPGTTTVRAVAPHPHAHGLFARHHHDRSDTDVVALDAGLGHGDVADDGGTSAGSAGPLMATPDAAAFAAPPALRFDWRAAAAAAAPRWTAGGPLRPPRA